MLIVQRVAPMNAPGKEWPGRGFAIAGKSPPQFVLDLAVDSLELGGKIPHQHLQAPLAVIDDAPQFGALIGDEPFVGKPDPGLHDLTTPQLRACVDEFDSPVWHALIPRRAASGPTMPQSGWGFRRLCVMVNGRVALLA
jgi:hypothetical protein